MSLLDRVIANSLDEDYAHVSEQRRRREGTAESPRDRLHPLAFAMLAVFGVLVATAAVQTARSAPVRESSRESLITQITERREELQALRAEGDDLRRENARSERDFLSSSGAGRALRDELDQLGVVSGLSPATGPGVRVVVDDNPRATSDNEVVYDKDLQRLVNGLWASGAQAIAINGQRLTAMTAIRTAGDAITVRRSLTRPYVVVALGNPDQLPARFIESEGGAWWLNLKSVYQLQFDMTTEDSITVPAAPPVNLRYAQRPGSAR